MFLGRGNLSAETGRVLGKLRPAGYPTCSLAALASTWKTVRNSVLPPDLLSQNLHSPRSQEVQVHIKDRSALPSTRKEGPTPACNICLQGVHPLLGKLQSDSNWPLILILRGQLIAPGPAGSRFLSYQRSHGDTGLVAAYSASLSSA